MSSSALPQNPSDSSESGSLDSSRTRVRLSLDSTESLYVIQARPVCVSEVD